LAKIENNYNALIIEKDNQIQKYEVNLRSIVLELAQATEEKLKGETIISKLKVFLSTSKNILVKNDVFKNEIENKELRLTMCELDYSNQLKDLQQTLENSTIEMGRNNKEQKQLADTIKDMNEAFAELQVNIHFKHNVENLIFSKTI
jgi:hypothetical protein